MISLECMPGGWWRIEAVNYAGTKFLLPLSKRGAFAKVSFGDRGLTGSLAIKSERVAAFRAYAAKRGVEVRG
jgi:hypothetical protein